MPNGNLQPLPRLSQSNLAADLPKIAAAASRDRHRQGTNVIPNDGHFLQTSGAAPDLERGKHYESLVEGQVR